MFTTQGCASTFTESYQLLYITMMSLCTQESFDSIGWEKGIEQLHQELLDAAASIDDKRSPPVLSRQSTQTNLFMALNEFDTITTPTPSALPSAKMGGSTRVSYPNNPVDGRRDIYMSHKLSELPPSTANMDPWLVAEHASRSYWNKDDSQLQARVHVAPQEVEPLPGTYRTWKRSHTTPKHTNGMMEMVIESRPLHFVPYSIPTTVPTPHSSLSSQKAVSYPLAERSIQVAKTPSTPKHTIHSKASHKKTSSSTARETPQGTSPTGKFPCPSNCGLVCKSKGDLKRHLQSLAHTTPSFPCPNDCGSVFTRVDAAERHSRSRRCPKKTLTE